MRLVPTTLAAGALAALAACSAPPPPAPFVQGAAPASFDGTYRGSVRLTAVSAGSNNDWCATTPAVTVIVVGGRFALSLPHPNVPGNPTIIFQVDVVPGGSFQNQSQNGTANIVGQVNGQRLQGEINGAGCQYAVAADKA